MTLRSSLIQCFVTVILIYDVAFSQNVLPPRPTFPDVFQVEIEGIFQDEKAEVDASLYYDRPNNRAVLIYTYQNETTTNIFNFEDNQFVLIEGIECSVSDIEENSGIFISYKEDKKTKKKIINPPEEIFFFTKSVFIGQGIAQFPSYIYAATINIPQYGLNNCKIGHVFSKPEEQKPNCDGHLCKPTLVSISVNCPTPAEEEPDISHVYTFYRFRFTIEDENVFQPPVGVHCDITSKNTFPAFPPYYSFSYDIIEEQKNTEEDLGADSVYKKVWYDTKLNLIRMDEFNENGLLLTSRIFDFYGRVSYTTLTIVPECIPTDLPENVALDQMTRLPKLLITKNPENQTDVVHIGKRNNHGSYYDVWTQTIKDDSSEAKLVYEYYFSNINRKGNASQQYLQLSHSIIYTYERDDETGTYELSLLTYLAISNFRSKPKEWEAFDVSTCYKKEQKKGFSLKVEGPPIIKGSPLYEEILEKLYIKLIILTNVSVIRINRLEGKFDDGMYISEFSGWILDKIQLEVPKVENGSEVKSEEPNMEEAYRMIEKAAADGKLTIIMKKNGEVQEYKITAIKEKEKRPGTCISGSVFAIVGVILLFVGITFGFVGYHVFLKKRTSLSEDKVQLSMLGQL